jgi:hypothetical protein
VTVEIEFEHKRGCGAPPSFRYPVTSTTGTQRRVMGVSGVKSGSVKVNLTHESFFIAGVYRHPGQRLEHIGEYSLHNHHAQ